MTGTDGPDGIHHVHHFFLPRAAQALGALWRKATLHPERASGSMLLFFVEQAIWGMSVLNRYSDHAWHDRHISNVNQYLSASTMCPPRFPKFRPLHPRRKLDRLVNAFVSTVRATDGSVRSSPPATCAALPVPDNSVDYVFTDPRLARTSTTPISTSSSRLASASSPNATPEAIVDRAKRKELADYQRPDAALLRASTTAS